MMNANLLVAFLNGTGAAPVTILGRKYTLTEINKIAAEYLERGFITETLNEDGSYTYTAI